MLDANFVYDEDVSENSYEDGFESRVKWDQLLLHQQGPKSDSRNLHCGYVLPNIIEIC
jgi:hypothetical protein